MLVRAAFKGSSAGAYKAHFNMSKMQQQFPQVTKIKSEMQNIFQASLSAEKLSQALNSFNTKS
jgi:hypothetical protein